MAEGEKHTPGPWEATYEDDSEHIIRMGSATQYTGIHESHHEIEYRHSLTPEDGEQFEEAEANARLIAAAPDLLEALKAVVAVADRKTVEFDCARAAIAKAEGRTIG